MNLDVLKKQIDNADVLFTDVFDTLVYRKNYPDYNKKLWCEAIKNCYNLKINLKSLINLRQNIEVNLRKYNKSQGFEFEFRYDQLLEKIYKKLNINEDYSIFKKTATEIELNIEFNSQELLSDSLELLNYCKSQNKKVICISDMYLSKSMIEELFKRHGIMDLIYDVNVSSESLLNKSSGKIYKHVISKYKDIDFNKSIMIGDNYWYDARNATDNGINGIFIDRGYLFDIYNKRKNFINNENYIKKLYLTKEFYKEFDYEFSCYLKLIKVCSYLFKNNINKVTYCSDTKDIIDRLEILNNELYFTNKIEFVESNKNSLVSKNGSSYIFELDKKYEIDLVNENIECFSTIVNYLVNIVLTSNIQKKSGLNNKTNSKSYDDNHSELIKLGESYSPIFEDFARWINKGLKENNIKKIYFFTREGEFFKEVFDKIKDKNISSEILEVSRVATFFPSFDSISIDEMKRLWSQYSTQSLSAMFKSLNLDKSKYAKIIYKYNLNLSDNIIHPWKNNKIIKLFKDKDFINLMSDDLNIARTNLLGYFKEKGFENSKERVAIVDIGWRGTIQDNICKIFTNKEIYGYYFGMQKFLNKQPINSKKFGYVNQYYGYFKVLGDVTPFEMLSNSPYGSTLGYVKKDNKYVAIRKIDNIENEEYYSCTKFIQEGIIKNIGKKSYAENDPINSLERIIYKPSKLVTNAYFNLKHNEEFGLGEFVSKKAHISKNKIKHSIKNAEKADEVRFDLQKTTWPNGYLVNNNLTEYIDKLPLNHFTDFDKVKITKKIAFILPDLLEGSGGHRTIIENANYLVEKGYQCDLYFNEDSYSTSESMQKKIKKLFDKCLCQVYIGTQLRTDYDMIFATYNVITPDIVKHADCPNKMYFVQDFEPWFNSMGDSYISAENTYKNGFRCITIGNWLSHKLNKEFNAVSSSFPFCANLSIYHPIDIEKENAVCFVFQPDKPRRCVELGLKALKIVKSLRPNVKIYLYGSKLKYNVDFECENLHIINLKKCNELYNKCKVGLCISSSNPSRIPFEMMASGLPVVDLYRENNLYDMPSEGVTLADSTPESIANEIIYLLDNPKIADKKRKYGIKYMKDYDLQYGFEVFYQQVKNILDGNDSTKFDAKLTYLDKPREISLEVMDAKKTVEYYGYRYDTSDYYRSILEKKRDFRLKLEKHKYIHKFLRVSKKMCKLPYRVARKVYRKIFK